MAAVGRAAVGMAAVGMAAAGMAAVGRVAVGRVALDKAEVQVGALQEFLDRQQSNNSSINTSCTVVTVTIIVNNQ